MSAFFVFKPFFSLAPFCLSQKSTHKLKVYGAMKAKKPMVQKKRRKESHVSTTKKQPTQSVLILIHTHTNTWVCTHRKWDLPLTRLARVCFFWTPAPSRQCLVKNKKSDRNQNDVATCCAEWHAQVGGGCRGAFVSDVSWFPPPPPIPVDSASNEGSRSSMHEVKVAIERRKTSPQTLF